MVDGSETPQGDPPPPMVPYRAGRAIQTLGAVFLAQFVFSVSALVAVMAIKPHVDNPLRDPDAIAAMIFVSGMTFALATLVAARSWARPLMEDRTQAGLGLWLPKTRVVIAWAAIGAGLAALYLGIAIVRYGAGGGGGGGGGLLAQAAARGGVSRLSWTVTALMLAPAGEELFFRGLLLKGFAASWGTVRASVLVTVLFLVLHLSETWHFWPATLFILLLSVAALAARLQTGSLVPSMAVHAAYNGVVVAFVYLVTG